MGLLKSVKQYKSYELDELARRKARKTKLKTYGGLKVRKVKKTRAKLKFDKVNYMKALGNPYK